MKATFSTKSIALLLMIVAGGSPGMAAPTLTSQIMIRGFHYRDINSGALWEEWTTNGVVNDAGAIAATVHETITDPPAFSSDIQIHQGYFFESDAIASAQFAGHPVLRGFAQMQLIDAPFTPVSAGYVGTRDHRVNAVSTFSDSIVVADPLSPIGTPVKYKLTFGITGFKSDLLNGQSNGSIAFLPPYTPALLGATIMGQSDHGYNFAALPGAATFVFQANAVNFSIDHFTLSLLISVSSDYSTASNQFGSSFDFYGTQGRCDFASTVVLTKIEITDADGNPIPGAQLKGADGAVWTPVATQPSLAISLVDQSHARITWPTNVADYNLEFTSDLQAASWATNTTAPNIIGDQFALMIDTSTGGNFYRLHKP